MPRSVFLLALLLPATALAVPMELTHQGRLFDGAGLPLDGPNDLTISLWDDPAGGAELWTDDYTALAFDDGYFSVQLGGGAALDSATFDGDDLFLQLAVNGTPLPARIQVVSVPFAIRAGTAASATDVTGGVVDASEVRVNGTTIIDSTGAISSSALPLDTLAALGCGAGQIAVHDGASWQCGPSVTSHTHDAADITSTLAVTQLPVGNGPNDVAAGDHLHGFSEITGQVAIGQLPTGTGGGDVALGDHTHAPGDADTLDGLDATDFAAASHSHSVDFADLGGSATVGQLPVGTTASDVAAGDHGHDLADLSGTWRQGLTLHLDASDPNSFNPSAPTVWTDISGTGVPATVGSGVTFATVGGVEALDFPGNANGYAQFDNRVVLDPAVMTGVMWVYNDNPDSGDFGGLYVNRNETTWNSANWIWFGEWASDRWYLRVNNGSCCNDLSQTGFSTDIAPNGEWHMVHFAYLAGGEWKVGSDGATVARGTNPGRTYPFVQEETVSTIGFGHGGSGGYWHGGIAEVMFWDRMVTDAELADLFDATRAKYGL